MKRKNIFIVSFIVMLIAVFFVSALLIGYFPVIGKLIAQSKLEKYVESSYNMSDSITCSYDWYDGKYISNSLNDGTLNYFLNRNTIYDEQVSDDINIKANEDYKKVIAADMEGLLLMPESVHIWTEFNADDYEKRIQRLYLLGVYNENILTENQSSSMACNIALTLIEKMGSDYNFTGIQLIYADINGMYEIAIDASINTKLTEELLLNNTVKKSDKELPEDYLAWRDKQTTQQTSIIQ